MKPYEVEILLAEVGPTPAEDKMYHITYDGTVMDKEGCTVLGGRAETIGEALESRYQRGMSADAAIRLAVELLGSSEAPLGPDQLEVAILDRRRPRRAFRRLRDDELAAILAG